MKFQTLLLLLVATPVWSSSAPTAATDVSGFSASKSQIEQDLRTGERYSELTAHQREEVVSALGRIENRLQGVDSVAELTAGEKAALMTDQELVNTILTRAAEDSRLICRQERKTGSHRPTTTCLTVGERRRLRQNGEEATRRILNSGLVPPLEPRN